MNNLSTPENPKDIEGVEIHAFYKKHKNTILLIAAVAIAVIVVYFFTRKKPQ